MDWLQKSAAEYRPNKVILLDEIKRRSVLAFEAQDKGLLPTSQDLCGLVDIVPRATLNTVSELVRNGDIVVVMHGKHRRYAVNYDIT